MLPKAAANTLHGVNSYTSNIYWTVIHIMPTFPSQSIMDRPPLPPFLLGKKKHTHSPPKLYENNQCVWYRFLAITFSNICLWVIDIVGYFPIHNVMRIYRTTFPRTVPSTSAPCLRVFRLVIVSLNEWFQIRSHLCSLRALVFLPSRLPLLFYVRTSLSPIRSTIYKFVLAVQVFPPLDILSDRAFVHSRLYYSLSLHDSLCRWRER